MTTSNGSGSVEDMGPIDFTVIEFPHRRTPGEGLPLFLELVDRGIIRVLDLVFIRKEADGTIVRLELKDLSPDLAVFEGATSGLLDQTDIDNAAAVIDPDSAAGLMVYENRWAGPLVTAIRHGGGQLVASERIPIQAILAQLDALEARSS